MDSSEQGKGDTNSEPVLVLNDPHHIRADARICRRAVIGGWNVPADLKQLVVDRMRELVVTGNDRQQLAASKLLINCDAIDQRTEAIDRMGRTEFIREPALPVQQPNQTVNIQVNTGSGAAPVQSSAEPGQPRDIWAIIDGIRPELSQAAQAELTDSDPIPAEDQLAEHKRKLAGISPTSHARAPEPAPEPAEPIGTVTEQGWTMPDREDEPPVVEYDPYSKSLSQWGKERPKQD